MERALSPSERALWLLDQAAALNGVVTARIEGRLDEARVRAGLARLKRHHPLLRVAVDATAWPRFVPDATPIPLRVVPRQNAATWRAVAEEELNTRFEPSVGPLMRVVLVAGEGRSDIVTCHHHMISDALSAIHQLGELLVDPDSEEPAPLPLRPALQDLLPPEAHGPRRLLRLHNFFWRQAATRTLVRPQKLALDERPPPSERRTRILNHTLAPEATTALVARARAEHTTLQGVLVAALLLAAGAEWDGAACTLGCFSAVDLRSRLTPPVAADEVGLYVSQATTFHRAAPERPLFEVAREVKTALTRRLDGGEPFVTLPLLGLFVPSGGDVVARFARRVDQAAPAALGVTNVGRLALPSRYGALTVAGLHFSIALGPVVPTALTACTLDGALAWNLLYVEPLISPARGAALAARVATSLREAIG